MLTVGLAGLSSSLRLAMVVESEYGVLDTGRYSGLLGGRDEFGPLFIVCPLSHASGPSPLW